MATPRRQLRLVMLELRAKPLPQAQEQSCFIESCRVARHQIRFVNLATEPQIRWSDVADCHAVIIGGAGAFSVTREHPFSAPLREGIEIYREAYMPDPAEFSRPLATLRPSVHADQILSNFLETYA